MGLNLDLSEEELRALLDPRRDENGDAQLTAGLQMPVLPSVLEKETELLHALKNAMRTLTVRVASLESEVGRLRAELSAIRGDEPPPAEKRIVVEGVTLAELPARLEASAAAAAPEAVEAAADFVATAISGGVSAGAEPVPPAGTQVKSAADDDALIPRAARHRKPEKRGFFTRLFH